MLSVVGGFWGGVAGAADAATAALAFGECPRLVAHCSASLHSCAARLVAAVRRRVPVLSLRPSLPFRPLL